MGKPITFDPARMPPRDEDGWALHPDLDLILEDRDDNDDHALDMDKLTSAGFEAKFVCFEADADDAAQDAYYERDEGASGWSPTTPDGDGWQLVGVYDTESTPFAMFVRRITPAAPSQAGVTHSYVLVPRELTSDAADAGELELQMGNDFSGAWEAVIKMLTAAPAAWKADNAVPRPMESAPRDGTLLRLLVQFSEHPTEDTTGPTWTIGANSFDDSGDDEWKFSGWCWEQDCFTQGEGTPVGWLPMLDQAATPAAQGLSASQADCAGLATFIVPARIHPDTLRLVENFAGALASKLAQAERKYGYTDGWKESDWLDECRAKLLEHVAKGDPRDVAAYCAFLWHHDERTAAAPAVVLDEAMMWQLDRLLPGEPIYDAEFGEDGHSVNSVPWRVYRDDDGYLWRATNNPDRDIEVDDSHIAEAAALGQEVGRG